MKHSAKEVDTGRILIIRLSAIGDVVRTLPALSTLRREYPNAHIAWAVEDKSRGILILTLMKLLNSSEGKSAPRSKAR